MRHAAISQSVTHMEVCLQTEPRVLGTRAPTWCSLPILSPTLSVTSLLQLVPQPRRPLRSPGLPCASPSKNSPHLQLLNCRDQVCLIHCQILLITVTKIAGGEKEGREEGKKCRRVKRKGGRKEVK